MKFAFTDDQLAFRDAVRDLLAKECPPEAVRAAWDNDAGRVDGLWEQLVEMGLVGAAVPEADGGLGLGALDTVLLHEEAGRAAAPEPLIETAAVAPVALGAAGVTDHLVAIAAGEAIVVPALETGAPVPFATRATHFLAAHGDDLHLLATGDVELTPVDGVDRSRRLATLGWAPAPDTLAASGAEGRAAIDAAIDAGALAASAQLVGLCQAMVDRTVEYVAHREQFGVPIGSFQAVKHHLADAELAVTYVAPLVHRAAWSLTTGDPEAPVHVSMAKAHASDAARTVSTIAVQCHGGMGYSFEYDLHLWMKRAWALAATWGDARHHRNRVARLVLD